MTMTRRYVVLFVDDDPLVLEGLRRTMRTLREECEFRFAGSGAQALAVVANEPVDVVVSDMHMPVMSGRDLLLSIRAAHPHVVRFLLSGNADRGSLIDSVGCAHQFLSKPCDPETLREAIRRSVRIRDELSRYGESGALAAIDTLPALPALYDRVVSCIRDSGTSIRDLARAIEQDVGLASTLLKAANSAFFGARNTVTTLPRACTLLGIEVLTGLVLNHGIVDTHADLFRPGAPLAWLPDHSFRVGALARAIALREGMPLEEAERAFLCGLLHDVGKIVIELVPNDRLEGRGPPAAEMDHAHAGGYLLALWGFPDAIVEAVTLHHSTTLADGQPFALLHAVGAANALVNAPDATTPAAAGLTGWTSCAAVDALWDRMRSAVELSASVEDPA
jgi:HD-like signal output (HDOD) protein/ActR/RegA family two-component response regulator